MLSCHNQQASREEELKVIGVAKKILQETSSGAVSQSYDFLQLHSQMRTRTDLIKSELLAAVKRRSHSAALAQLASKKSVVMQYGGANQNDVFAKIEGLVNDMSAKLVTMRWQRLRQGSKNSMMKSTRLPRQILNLDLEVFRKYLRSSVSIVAVQKHPSVLSCHNQQSLLCIRSRVVLAAASLQFLRCARVISRSVDLLVLSIKQTTGTFLLLWQSIVLFISFIVDPLFLLVFMRFGNASSCSESQLFVVVLLCIHFDFHRTGDILKTKQNMGI